MQQSAEGAPISADDHHPRKRVRVCDSEMSYVDVGKGDPIVFLHGNPTSSYLWRNVISHVSDLGRCLAPDFIGMGESLVSPTYSYRFADHARYLDAWFEAANVGGNIIFVLHDWGSALGLDYAFRNQERAAGIAYMESVMQVKSWSAFGSIEKIFRAFRTPFGDTFCLDYNLFVEKVLPENVIRKMTEEEMTRYRAPYPTPVSRIPTLVWARDVPVKDEPNEVNPIVDAYSAWIATSPIPKLFVAAEPGTILYDGSPDKAFCDTLPNQRTVTVKGRHFVQEDSPNEIGAAVREFVQSVRSGS